MILIPPLPRSTDVAEVLFGVSKERRLGDPPLAAGVEEGLERERELLVMSDFFIRILRARTNLVVQPPTATEIVPAQYRTRNILFQLLVLPFSPSIDSTA